uniref:Uncharacterized protein n=1 Tax=Physcomitrium patens TaxID=3218 RepID=A0A2K1IV37_PHYPA|nr:hypothetical protein PHYPA_025084 [Physcomitrium patens]
MMEADVRRNNLLKEKVAVLEFKINKLGIAGRAYYEASKIKLRRNRYLIRAARTQNMLLHSALFILEQKEMVSRKEASNLIGIRKQASDLRIKFDSLRKKSITNQIHKHFTITSLLKKITKEKVVRQSAVGFVQLAKQITDTRATEIQCADVLDPNTPPLITIRWLDIRLEAIFRKTKNTHVLEKHYESLLIPMREEHTLYNFQLESLTNIIALKNNHIMQLKMVMCDGIKSRDQAKAELEDVGMSKAEQIKLNGLIVNLKEVMEVDTMRAMYQQLLFQQKQILYLEQVKAELILTLQKLRNEAPIPATHKRRSTFRLEEVGGIAASVKESMQRLTVQTAQKDTFPLELLVEGTHKLISLIHQRTADMEEMETNAVPEKLVLAETESKLVFLLKGLDRKVKFLESMKAKQIAKAVKPSTSMG